MEAGELEQPLHEKALEEIERSVHGKLKAHRLSDAFIERCSEDAIQKGLLEYLRARESGAKILNRDAFVVQAAFRRALDELRREARQADGAAVETLLDSGRHAAPASEELALEHLQAQELQAAIEELTTEERQVLALHYFEQMSAARAAKALFCSESTYRRRLGDALRALRKRLGVTAPEPGSGLAFEVGLAAWTSLGGARVALAGGPTEQALAFARRCQDGLLWLLDRAKAPVARADAGGLGERIGVIASGPAGKLAGGCAAAAVACALGGVVGPGISIESHDQAAKRSARGAAAQPSPSPVNALPETLATSRSGESQPAPEHAPLDLQRGSEGEKERAKGSSEERRVERQTSGIARAAADSTAAPEAQASSVEPEVVTVTPDQEGSSSSESEAAANEFNFESQRP